MIVRFASTPRTRSAALGYVHSVIVATVCVMLCCSALAATADAATDITSAAPVMPMTTTNPAAPLYGTLPQAVRKAGVLRFVGDSHPPYRILSDDRKVRDGIDADLARAFERVLGIPIEHHVVNSLSATLGGLESGRYDVAMGPAVATRERQMRFDAVSWMTTKPTFVFPSNRSARYARVEDLCGKRIAYVAGSVTERVTNRVIELCIQAGLPPALHVPLVDTNMSLVATQAGRADVAGMTRTAALHAAHVNGERFQVFSDETNTLGVDLLSLFVTKRSNLGQVMLSAMDMLLRNGDYQRVMAKWGVTGVSIETTRLNAAK